MRITILAMGTHGDVRPFVALGVALEKAGHRVRLASRDNYREFVTGFGLEFASLGAEVPAPENSSLSRPLPKNLMRTVRIAGSFLPGRREKTWPEDMPWLDRLIEDSWKACEDAEAVVAGILFFWVNSFAEKLNVPCYLGLLQPCTPTRAFPNLFFTQVVPRWLRLGSINWLTHRTVERAFYEVNLRMTNPGRKAILGMLPMRDVRPLRKFYNEGAAILYAYSPTLAPKPPDWPEWHHVTGYWFLDRSPEWEPPAALAQFLSAGPPPVCVGFGSFADKDPKPLTDLVLESLRRTGQRGLLLTGWGGLTQSKLPDNMFAIESAPHDWLFPRVAAVVHHGGAGTTGAVVRAGVPSIAIPWRGDHPFFAERAYDIGAGPPPIPKRRLSANRLTAAIEAAVRDPRIREGAAAAARRMSKEDGIARALEIITAGFA